MHRIASSYLIGFLFASAAFAAGVPKIMGDEGATYSDLIREKALVTVVLNVGARSYNLRITGVHESSQTISVETQSGEPTAFKFADIREIRVQKGVHTDKKPDPGTVLSAEEKKTVDQAAARAYEIFTQSRETQIKMPVALVLAASTHMKKADAITYLKELRGSNDPPTAMLAAGYLLAVGEAPTPATIATGFASGNRRAKALAAKVVGTMRSKEFIPDIEKLLRDPAVEIFPEAARAAGRLKDKDVLPILFEGLHSLTPQKADACVDALKDIGGPDVVERLKQMLPGAKREDWFSIVQVLFELGEPEGTSLMSEALKQPAFERKAALLLAGKGDAKAIKFLRDYLTRPNDPDYTNLTYRAAVGLALFSAGDVQAKGIIQEVLSKTANDVYARGKTEDKAFKDATILAVHSYVCLHVGAERRRELLPTLQVPMQSTNPGLAGKACLAIMEIGNPDFAEKIKGWLD